MVNKISWDKAGRVSEPGRYLMPFGWLTISADDLAVWKLYPTAHFTLVEILTEPDNPGEFRLGTFELPDGAALDLS